MTTAISPIILHPLVGVFVGQLSRNALRILIYVGCESFKANNRTISTIRHKKDTKTAHVLINRQTLLKYCSIDEEQWAQAVKELDKLNLLWVSERNTMRLDRYFMLAPNKNYVNKIVFHTKHTIPKIFRGNK